MEHSVSWVKEAPTPFLVITALAADDLVQDEEATTFEVEVARESRRIACDELERRGAIEPYRLV